MKITKTLNDNDGKTVYEWQVGEKAGYCATEADAVNDAMLSVSQIACYDLGPTEFDRFTVVYLDTKTPDGKCQYVGMSERPCHPQGFGQHGEGVVGNLGKPIQFGELPEECRKLVIRDLLAIYNATTTTQTKGQP